LGRVDDSRRKSPNDSERTASLLRCKLSHDVIKILLETTPKLNVDARGSRAVSTPLHVACFRSQLEVVRLLLEAGADPTMKNNNAKSCL
jgi:ankyrin repeat protein